VEHGEGNDRTYKYFDEFTKEGINGVFTDSARIDALLELLTDLNESAA